MRSSIVLAVTLLALTARAGNIQVPSVSLPSSELTTPSLLFGPSDLPTLTARKLDPAYSGYYGQVKGLVDGQLAGLKNNAGGLGDDLLSKAAKGAAILHQLGDTPASQFASYRDAAVAALKAVGSRSPGTGLSGNLDVLQDSPRLQSMAEAYDLLRGTGVAPADDSAIRNTLANWAEAFRQDVNLTGAIIVAGHRDNWGIKGGSALISTALAMSSHSSASKWMSFGMQLTNESFAAVASDTGWWRESPHYVNYTLNNLVSVAVHVKNRTGVNWFPALRPLVTTALDMRQPDGLSIPFEEGVTNVFPYDVLAGQYPDLAPQMLWAWVNSSRDASAYENQAFHAATRFVLNVDVAAQEPTWSPTRFIGADAHVQVLRSDWSTNAIQATMITAKDHSSSTLVASRHNMQNPLDLSVYGAGKLLLVTSSGGPQVTNSANRNYYLQPSSRNVPLVSGTAPYITDESKITSDRRLDADFFDSARTSTTAYSGASRVSRTLAMIDDRYFVIADEAAGNTIDYALPFRARGTYTGVSTTANLLQTRWDFQGVALDLWALSDKSLTLKTTSGYYASAWGNEESIAGIEVKLNTTNPRVLTILEPRSGSRAPLTVQPRGLNSGLSAVVSDGNFEDRIIFYDGGVGVVRNGGLFYQLGAAGLASLSGESGLTLFSSSTPVTLSAWGMPGFLWVLDMSPDTNGPSSLTLGEGAIYATEGYCVKVDGKLLDRSRAIQSAGYLHILDIPPGARVEVGLSKPPEIQGESTAEVVENQELTLSVVGSDVDGQQLTYSYFSTPPLPGSPKFDSTTGTLTWTPGFDVATQSMPATFSVVTEVSDGFYVATQTTVVTVKNVNRPPVVPDQTPQGVTQDAELSLPLGITDPDGDALTLTASISGDVTVQPSIDASGTLHWTPTKAVVAGRYTIAIEASDGVDAVMGSVVVEVKEHLNRAPIFDAPTEPLTAEVGRLLEFTIHATDPDGDEVTYSTNEAQVALSVMAGTVLWTPTEVGQVTLTFTATDALGATATLPVMVNVSPRQQDGIDERPFSPTTAAAGCGCSSGSSSAALLLLPLLVWRRRRSMT